MKHMEFRPNDQDTARGQHTTWGRLAHGYMSLHTHTPWHTYSDTNSDSADVKSASLAAIGAARDAVREWRRLVEVGSPGRSCDAGPVSGECERGGISFLLNNISQPTCIKAFIENHGQ